MKTLPLSTGHEVTLKDFCTRKIRKEINKAMFKDATFDADLKTSAIQIERVDSANDFEVQVMIEKVTLGGANVEVNQDFIDNLPDRDFKILLAEVQKLTSSEIPKEDGGK